MGLTILLVEDDPILGKSLRQMLTLEGFDTNWSQRFEDAKGLLSERKFNCCVFDIGLPDGSGLDLCQYIRGMDSHVPILFLTAQTDEETLLKAFSLGANDFLKKPFNQKELVARLKALTRNINGSDEMVVYGDARLNLLSRELRMNDSRIEFNNTEIQVLHFFILNAEKVVTREKLIRFLGKENDIFDRTIDSHISHIRKQLKEHQFNRIQIKSIYGVGYKFEVL